MVWPPFLLVRLVGQPPKNEKNEICPHRCFAFYTQTARLREKCLRPLLLMVVMETQKYTCVPCFTSMYCMVCKFEK